MQLPKLVSLFLFLLIFGFFGCSNDIQEEKESGHLGVVHFKVTGSPEALPHFEEGLLLLHSFEFEDSRVAFLKAQEIDSNFIMAFWGEAMTYNHPLWRSQKHEKGRAIIDSMDIVATAILSEKGTEIERDLWQSLKILYAEEGDKNTRDKAYAKYMEKFESIQREINSLCFNNISGDGICAGEEITATIKYNNSDDLQFGCKDLP